MAPTGPQRPQEACRTVSTSWTSVIHGAAGPDVAPGAEAEPLGVAATADSSAGAYDFWTSEALIEKLAEQNTVMFPMNLQLTARSRVHKLEKDCEIHIAPASRWTLLTRQPRGQWWLEPPNLRPPGGR